MTLLLVGVRPEVVDPFLNQGALVQGFRVRCSPIFFPGPWALVVVPVDQFFQLQNQNLPNLCWMPYGPSAQLTRALAAGAWDYLKEPWDRDEMEARAARLLPKVSEWQVMGQHYRLQEGLLVHGCQKVALSRDESTAIETLLSRRGVALAPELLETALWRGQLPPNSRALAMLISRLRKKFIKIGWTEGNPIIADRGLGYRLP
ncbi:MAG: response regulator transcription factor [Spirochaetales bacterium]|nr:response regulator transcription factor [Spirochaetales bacterium]